MTYYKYAERESDSQVNWAEVSKGLSDTILQVDKDRREKRAAIDAATREAQTTLANAPKGENTTASAWTINYANDMMNYRLTLDRLLKSGQMKLNDYQVAAQNSVDSTNLVFTISKEYQDEYKAIMDRSRTLGKNGLPLSSVMELELASLNESYSNLSNTVPTINSTNGMVYLSTPGTGKDGVQTLGDNYVSLQSLRNRMKAKVDMYDVEGISAAKVASLGENTISQLGQTNFRRTGVVTDITDATLRDTWTEFTKTTAKEMVANPFSQASIMADGMKVNPKTGQAYKGVYNRAEWEADKTGNLILFENTNGTGPLVPVFTEQQTKDAEEFVQAGLSKYVDKKTEKRPFQEPEPQRPQQWEVEAANAAKDQTAAAGAWNQLYTGKTPAEKKAAADILLGTPIAQSAGLLDIDLETKPGQIILKYADAKKNRTIDFVDANNNPISLRDFAGKGVELHGVVDRDKAVKAGGGGKTFGRITDYSGIRSSRAGEAAPPVAVAVPLSAITEESGNASSTLQSALPEGFVVTDNSIFGFGNGITVVAPNGKVYEYTSKQGPTDAATIKVDLEAFVKTNNVPAKDAAAKAAAAAAAAAAAKKKSPIPAPGGGSFGSDKAPRKIKG
jgi:hypothetical protein